MNRIVLVTGGSRSGKSSYAQALAEQLPGTRAFIATCPVIDREMNDRIHKHQQDRRGRGWTTIEAAHAAADAIRNATQYQVLLLDCLTLWINNLLYEAQQRGAVLSEATISDCCRELIGACRDHGGNVIMVTNEVGMGVVPENASARLFRDLAGRANQEIARACHEVILVACGYPIVLKSETSNHHQPSPTTPPT